MISALDLFSWRLWSIEVCRRLYFQLSYVMMCILLTIYLLIFKSEVIFLPIKNVANKCTAYIISDAKALPKQILDLRW